MAKPGIGIAYCVNHSRPYRQMLDTAVRSLKRFHSDWPIEIVQLAAGSDFFDSVRWHFGSRAEGLLKRWIGRKDANGLREVAFAQKAKLFFDPPFEHTIFLDCDTIVLKSLGELADALTKEVDIIIQKWLPGSMYDPIPPFTTSPIRRFNAGAVLFTTRFAEAYHENVKIVGSGITEIYEPDQFILSRSIEQMPTQRVIEHPTLQLINRPTFDGHSYHDFDEDVIRKACIGESEYAFYHYIYKKKCSLAAVRRWTGL